jgi:hypothetical protein
MSKGFCVFVLLFSAGLRMRKPIVLYKQSVLESLHWKSYFVTRIRPTVEMFLAASSWLYYASLGRNVRDTHEWPNWALKVLSVVPSFRVFVPIRRFVRTMKRTSSGLSTLHLGLPMPYTHPMLLTDGLDSHTPSDHPSLQCWSGLSTTTIPWHSPIVLQLIILRP